MIHNLEKAAEQAVHKLPELIAGLHDLELQARQTEHTLKHLEGQLIAESKDPVSIRKEVVKGSSQWIEAAEAEARARAALAEGRALIDKCKTVVSLYQSELRERR